MVAGSSSSPDLRWALLHVEWDLLEEEEDILVAVVGGHGGGGGAGHGAPRRRCARAPPLPYPNTQIGDMAATPPPPYPGVSFPSGGIEDGLFVAHGHGEGRQVPRRGVAAAILLVIFCLLFIPFSFCPNVTSGSK